EWTAASMRAPESGLGFPAGEPLLERNVGFLVLVAPDRGAGRLTHFAVGPDRVDQLQGRLGAGEGPQGIGQGVVPAAVGDDLGPQMIELPKIHEPVDPGSDLPRIRSLRTVDHGRPAND